MGTVSRFGVEQITPSKASQETQPYTGIADLFVVDPDGFIIRKWNSKELNNGVLTGRFQLPEYPKVGFWTIRVAAQGQVNEKAVKVEKYYTPKFEVSSIHSGVF